MQDETVKAKRLQSMGELPGLLPPSSSLHGRPSIAALGSSDTVDVDDSAVLTPTVTDTSISKSPINASNSECSFSFFILFCNLFYIISSISFFLFYSTFRLPFSFVTVTDDIVAESLEKLMENKLVREKKMELEKKLESLRKKHEKEKLRVQSSQRSSIDGEKHKSKFYMGNKLVKRLSNKNM